jgi:hypothetical protein
MQKGRTQWRTARRKACCPCCSTVTVFGTPIDVTVAELALECFYPADAATAEILQRMAKTRRAAS